MKAEFSWWVSNRPMAWPCGEDLHFWDCWALGSSKGTTPECWGVAKALGQLLLLVPWVWAWAERSQSQTCPPRRYARVSPELQICIDASPMDIFISSFGQLWAPQNAFPSGWQGVQNRCGHSNKIHVLLNPILRSNSAPPLKNLSLAATAIPKRWGKGRKKGFFTANREWERPKEGVQAVRFEWHVDNRQESKQGTLPPSLPRVCAALQRCT